MPSSQAVARRIRISRAIAELADALLASPHFGETWGRHWLDVARFAESSGGGRTLLFKDAWRYRDYVIDAFNADVPFDRFIREQLAGDLLPAPTPAEQRRQLTATAFLALGPTNYEEQDKQQLRFDVIDEQLDTLGRAFLGQTIGCARCHDHKFDPIPQRDYYALAGILASTRTLCNYTDNVARWIAAPLPADGPQRGRAAASTRRRSRRWKTELEAAKTQRRRAARKRRAATWPSPARPIAPTRAAGHRARRRGGQGRRRRGSTRSIVRSFIGEGYLTTTTRAKARRPSPSRPTLPKAGRYEVRLAYAPTAANRANNVPRARSCTPTARTRSSSTRTQLPPIDGRFVSLGQVSL